MVKFITFDLYGTLVDWRISIKNALDFIKPGMVDDFFKIEYEYIKNLNDFEPYSNILKNVLRDLLKKYKINFDDDYEYLLLRMFAKSQFFPDSLYGLLKLKNKFKLGIISNTENSIIKVTLYGLEDLFNFIVTAEDTGYYKPKIDAFKKAFELRNIPIDEVLHVSSYPKYDLEPAEKLGIKNIMLDRYGYSWPRKIKKLDEILSIFS
ncbi:MAG: HAD family hydrolase [Thermoplasmata archaeon]|nr:HAD-IA family hydrolase [Thermoplasmata archaeon]